MDLRHSPFGSADVAIAFGKLPTHIVFDAKVHQQAFAMLFSQHDVLLQTFGIHRHVCYDALLAHIVTNCESYRETLVYAALFGQQRLRSFHGIRKLGVLYRSHERIQTARHLLGQVGELFQ